MKTRTIHLSSILLVTAAMSMCILTSCKEDPYIQNPGDNGHNLPGDSLVNWSDNDSAFLVEVARLKQTYGESKVLSVDQAIEACKAHKGWKEGTAGTTTKFTSPDTYYVYGLVNGTYSSKPSTESAVYFYMTSSPFSVSTKRFLAYQLTWNGGTSFPHGYAKDVANGRWVIINANLCLFGTTPETDGGKVTYTSYTTPKIPTIGSGTEADPYTIADAIRLENEADGVKENEWITGLPVGAVNTKGELITTRPFEIEDWNSLALADESSEYEVENVTSIVLGTAWAMPIGDYCIAHPEEVVKVQGRTSKSATGVVQVAKDDVKTIKIGSQVWSK